MGRVERSVEIKASPEKVWEMLALDKIQEWEEIMGENLEKLEYTSEVQTPEDKYRIGATAHIIKEHEKLDFEVIDACMHGQSEKQRSLLETGFKMTLKKGTVVSAKENEKILGVMRFMEYPECKKEFLLQGLDLLPALLFLRGKALRLRKWGSIWAKHHPDKSHCHLEALGVLPERQGQGIGSLLLGHFCAYVDQLKQAAYLETDQPKNVRLYKRFGFNVEGEAPVLTVPNWFMWRPPCSE